MWNGPTDMSHVMGIGAYVGEVRQGPDGNLYEWVAGVDGLGNPIGFWKKAFSLVKGAAQRVVSAGLSRLIPGPIKHLARRACGVVDQLGPAVTSVPAALPYYAGAKGFCRVLRGAGIAGMGYGLMEAPDVPAGITAAVPGPVRTAARTVCNAIDRIGPVVKYIPVAGSYHKKAQGLCTALRNAGIAGADGSIMQAPDGRLYEVVEGIGEFGEARQYIRPVGTVVPPYVRRYRAARRRARMLRRARFLRHRAQILTSRAQRPVPPPRINGFGQFY